MGGPCSPDFPKSTITAGPRTTHYAALCRKATSSSAWKWRGKKGGLGLGHHISAAGRPAGSAWIRYKEARAQQGTSGLYVYVDRYVEIEKGRADDGSR